MHPPEDDCRLTEADKALDQDLDQETFRRQVKNMQQLVVLFRWMAVGISWITIGALSLWGLRLEIALWLDYFTWTAVRYTLAYNPIQAVGLSFCVGMTAAVLVWQSRNILMGLPRREQQQLEQQVLRIRKQGPSHPLWRWICH